MRVKREDDMFNTAVCKHYSNRKSKFAIIQVCLYMIDPVLIIQTMKCTNKYRLLIQVAVIMRVRKRQQNSSQLFEDYEQ